MTGGLADAPGLCMDDRAISISSSASVTLGRGTAGLAGGASGLVGATGGLGAPGFAATGTGFAGGFDVAIGFLAAADQPHAGQRPLKFNASPHSLQSGIGWLASSSFGPLRADFGPAIV